MKSHTALITTSVLAAALIAASAGAQAEQGPVQSRLFLGTNSLDSDWGVHDEQDVIGVITDIKANHWPVAIAADVFGAGNEHKRSGNKSEAYVASAHLGLRLKCDDQSSWLRPYVGAGIALAEAETKPNTDNDGGIGYWVGIGADIPLGERLSIGADLRYSDVDVELSNSALEASSLNAGGTQFGLTLGYSW